MPETPRDGTLHDRLPDARDGLTRRERIVLWVLHETQRERGGRNVPTAMLSGRVCEHVHMTPEELMAILARLGSTPPDSPRGARWETAPPSPTSLPDAPPPESSPEKN